MPERQLNSADKLQAAFRCFDKDGSGLVSAAELQAILDPSGTSDIKEQIASYDKNGDGEISFDEFMSIMNEKMKTNKA